MSGENNRDEIPMSEQLKKKSKLGGIAIIAGSAIGAGMFSLPVVSAGMWFGWTLLVMLFSWFCFYHSSLMILEINQHYPRGASFNTFVKDTLGARWNHFNSITLAFILYILSYAYISGGGSIVSHTLDVSLGLSLPPILAGLIFAIGLSAIVWVSTGLVGRMNAIFVGGMVITFILSAGDLSSRIEVPWLLESEFSYAPFIVAALPYYLAAFAFHTAVPSLTKFYGPEDPLRIRDCIFYGSITSLVVYTLWNMSVMGTIGRENFQPIVESGGNIGAVVGALSEAAQSDRVAAFLNVFANLAVVSSFLGAAIGLFDFIADKFKFDDSPVGRLKTALVCFVPPTIGGVFFPNGFIYAIGLVGLCAIVVATIVPSLGVLKSRSKFTTAKFQVRGGRKLVYLILGYGMVLTCCYFLSAAKLLPVL